MTKKSVLKAIQKDIENLFKSKCIVNKFGNCKYWNRDEKNNSYADDKFFPEELKVEILALIKEK